MQADEWQAVMDQSDYVHEKWLHYAPDVLDFSLIRSELKPVSGKLWLSARLSESGEPVVVFEHSGQGLDAGTEKLATVLGFFAKQNIHLDLLEGDLEAYLKIIAIIHEKSASQRVTISGPSLLWNRKLSKIYPGSITLSDKDIPYLYLPDFFWPLFVSEIAVTYRDHFFRTGQAAFIKRCHRRGLRVDFRSVPDVQTARALLADGADGIITAQPELYSDLFPVRKLPRLRKPRSELESAIQTELDDAIAQALEQHQPEQAPAPVVPVSAPRRRKTKVHLEKLGASIKKIRPRTPTSAASRKVVIAVEPAPIEPLKKPARGRSSRS